ncbi:3-phosphoshikimate 1-carboxyvinyltransferase [Bifidobacterium aemilianum]|uniref:3-phosphoshikimate 1-carboxyvinyltransferase n=1 Tax=Bifidobacterium aemilianum TaxID=2493120 RepID=A0A366K9S5_9BIFI|nr:3-phosphoshikimate 1-carboxyvinyltransferase [Bifidobacterium aemilianum]RBP98349.1 3-phosphoshikimate 1-carboxyvinyltransferase [Bifidobacterium aemilianum]
MTKTSPADCPQSSPKATSPTGDPWPAPLASGPLQARVAIPGSKSLSNRYLVLAALGSRPVQLEGLLRSRDTELMMAALGTMGVVFQEDPQDPTLVTVLPPKSGRFTGGVTIDCGLAGTVMRFLPGLAMFADGPVSFDGDRQAYERPMRPLLDGLDQLGVRVDYQGREGHLPFRLEAPDDRSWLTDGPASVSIDSSSSSQFISGLLLIGSRLPGGLHLVHSGDRLPSLPHIRMTMADIKAAGGLVTMGEHGSWDVRPSALNLPDRVLVEPDLSNAAPFLGAALIAGGSVSVPRWPQRTTQPGGLLPGILQAMGARISRSDTGDLTVTAEGQIQGLGTFDLSAAGEIAPSIAALAVLAEGPSRLVGIGHLRGHETNRLAALETEITRIGGQAKELDDGLDIVPVDRAALHGDLMETYADHRMATFAAMLGLAIPGIRISNVGTTRKTIPDFTGMWTAMLGH